MTDNTGGDAKSVNEHDLESISSDNRLKDELSNDRQRHLFEKLFIQTDNKHDRAEVRRLNPIDFKIRDINLIESNRLVELPNSALIQDGLVRNLDQQNASLPHSDPVEVGSNHKLTGEVIKLPNSAGAKLVVNEVNCFNVRLPNSAQANQGQTNSCKTAYRTPKKQIRRSLRKGKMLSDEKIEKTPELLKLFKKMENVKKETGFKGNKLYEEVENCPEIKSGSPQISKVKLLKMKYENTNSTKRLSKGGPIGVQENGQKISLNSRTSSKNIYACSGGRGKKKLDVQNVDPNQPKLGDFWKGLTKSKENGT